jgi:hypothetical protein
MSKKMSDTGMSQGNNGNNNLGQRALEVLWRRAAVNLTANIAPANRNRMLRGLGPAMALTRNRNFQSGANRVLHRKAMTTVLMSSTRLDEIKYALRQGGDATAVPVRLLRHHLENTTASTIDILCVLVKAGAGSDGVAASGSGNNNHRDIQSLLTDRYIDGNERVMCLLRALWRLGYRLPHSDVSGLAALVMIFPAEWSASGISRWVSIVTEYSKYGKNSKEVVVPAVDLYFDKARELHGRVVGSHVERLLKSGAVITTHSYYKWLRYAREHAGNSNRGLNTKVLQAFRMARGISGSIYDSLAVNGLNAGQIRLLRRHGLRERRLVPSHLRKQRKQNNPRSTR